MQELLDLFSQVSLDRRSVSFSRPIHTILHLFMTRENIRQVSLMIHKLSRSKCQTTIDFIPTVS